MLSRTMPVSIIFFLMRTSSKGWRKSRRKNRNVSCSSRAKRIGSPSRFKRTAAKHYVSPSDFADAYAELGRKEETIRYLEQSYRERSPHLVFLQSDPFFDFLHSDPRYRAIVN